MACCLSSGLRSTKTLAQLMYLWPTLWDTWTLQHLLDMYSTLVNTMNVLRHLWCKVYIGPTFVKHTSKTWLWINFENEIHQTHLLSIDMHKLTNFEFPYSTKNLYIFKHVHFNSCVLAMSMFSRFLKNDVSMCLGRIYILFSYPYRCFFTCGYT